jgi:hypothetical protein
MKLYHRFRIRERGFPPEHYRVISASKPENRGTEDFIVESKPGDEVNACLIKQLVAYCERHSLPRATVAGEFAAYEHTIRRHYEVDDLGLAPLLLLQTQKQMFRERLSRDTAGRLMLPASPSFDIASGMFNNVYIVSDSTRKTLESGHLVGLLFRDTVRKDAAIFATTVLLWEIDSNIKLPKMVNSILNPHSAIPCYAIDERPYRDGEPHYRQSNLEPLEGTDIARTFESLGSEPGLIISHRFYQHCYRNDLLLAARPVRIDPDCQLGR